MRGLLALALLLALIDSAAAAVQARLDPKDGAVLPTEVAHDLLNQCSRGAPQNVTGTWVPTATQIRELEARLPAALEAIALQRGSEFGGPKKFLRQYAGIVSKGRRLIYMNAFPAAMNDEQAQYGLPPFDWQHKVMRVCDGGPSFFGVEYDPQTKTFSHFEFNGAI